MKDKKKSLHYRESKCCASCQFCTNVTYNDDWGTHYFSECPLIESEVKPNGFCDGYREGEPSSETRSVTY